MRETPATVGLGVNPGVRCTSILSVSRRLSWWFDLRARGKRDEDRRMGLFVRLVHRFRARVIWRFGLSSGARRGWPGPARLMGVLPGRWSRGAILVSRVDTNDKPRGREFSYGVAHNLVKMDVLLLLVMSLRDIDDGIGRSPDYSGRRREEDESSDELASHPGDAGA